MNRYDHRIYFIFSLLRLLLHYYFDSTRFSLTAARVNPHQPLNKDKTNDKKQFCLLPVLVSLTRLKSHFRETASSLSSFLFLILHGWIFDKGGNEFLGEKEFRGTA